MPYVHVKPEDRKKVGRKEKIFSDEEKQEMFDLYWTRRMTYISIAKQFNISLWYVKKIIKSMPPPFEQISS